MTRHFLPTLLNVLVTLPSRLMGKNDKKTSRKLSPTFFQRHIPCSLFASHLTLPQGYPQSHRSRLPVLPASQTVDQSKVDNPSSQSSKSSPPPDSTLDKWLEQQFQTRKASAQSSSPSRFRTTLSSPISPVVEVGKGSQYDLPFFDYRERPNPPKVVYTSSPSEANEYLSQLNGNALGFDLEWPVCRKERDPTTGREVRKQGKVALLQFCDEHMILLYHVRDHTTLPSEITRLLRDPKIYKLGVAVGQDGSKITRDFPDIFPKLPLELLEQKLARMVDPERWKHRTYHLISLADLCKTYLGKRLDKSEDVRMGDWSKATLSGRDIAYAANDVYASLQIYLVLTSMAEQEGIKLEFNSMFTGPGACLSPGDPIITQDPMAALLKEYGLSHLPLKTANYITRTLKLFKEGKSVQQAAEARNRKSETIL
ncbi:hypothetical protein V865_007989 [Kwoniella europaea PYCC6329]|uniref:3'-5' exonuclease domain-containing protein n=1 Tax=Kwoniella europaea PYCC6329 TaxID=1423913 RepID=A0AAX4KTV7_9TREE